MIQYRRPSMRLRIKRDGYDLALGIALAAAEKYRGLAEAHPERRQEFLTREAEARREASTLGARLTPNPRR